MFGGRIFEPKDLVAGYPVAGFSRGSNANGEWFKWFDIAGNVVMVVQTWTVVTVAAANDTTVNLPVAMPNTNYSVQGGANSVNSAGVSGAKSPYVSSSSFYIRLYNPSGGAYIGNATVRGSAIWVKV